MPTKQKYNLVRDKIIEAVPERFRKPVRVLYERKRYEKNGIVHFPCWKHKYVRQTANVTIRLADVLLADMQRNRLKILDIWDLSHNSLSWHYKNKPEVIDFLFEILGGK